MGVLPSTLPAVAMPKKRSAPQVTSRFLNRELSWLEFNQRVLDEAKNPSVPLLERLKFFCITHSNLDEFFEVRVAGLKQQLESGAGKRGFDGLTPSESLRAVLKRTRRMVDEAYELWRDQLVPRLAAEGIRFWEVDQLDAADRSWLDSYYKYQVHPVLTPLGIDPAHPFPQLANKNLYLVVQLTVVQQGETQRRLAVVQAPRGIPRLIRLPRDDGRRDYVLVGKMIGHYLDQLFPGTLIEGWWTMRVTRNSELYIDEEEVQNLLKAVENELHNRRKGEAVRLELDAHCPPDVRAALLGQLGLDEEDLFLVNGPINVTRLLSICEGEHAPELRDPPFIAPISKRLRGCADIFEEIRKRDILLHHPYESYDSVVEFLQQAAADPRVLAIKQTLYRTGGDQRIVGALMNAARNGKQVTAVVELKARFDEANNILWARRLEENGVHVTWGLVGYKIHCKMALVVRNDEDVIRRYLHLATGNYNPSTARLYTDLGLLTCRPDFADDATNLFNLLTGICRFQGTQRLLVAPFTLHNRVIEMIEREAENARKGLPGRIFLKLNALVDEQAIEALYLASQAGVRIDLVVRGTCCLRPGVPGLSENIHVLSIIDRFLEHSRIYYFENARQPEVWVASADWMPRNFFRRIEIAFPILDGATRDRLIEEIVAVTLADNLKARRLQSDGSYRLAPPPKGVAPHRSQEEFMRIARSENGSNGTRKVSRGPEKMELRKRPEGLE